MYDDFVVLKVFLSIVHMFYNVCLFSCFFPATQFYLGNQVNTTPLFSVCKFVALLCFLWFHLYCFFLDMLPLIYLETHKQIRKYSLKISPYKCVSVHICAILFAELKRAKIFLIVLAFYRSVSQFISVRLLPVFVSTCKAIFNWEQHTVAVLYLSPL